MKPKAPKPRVRKSTATPVPMPRVTPGGRTAKPMPMAGPKKKSTSTAKPKAQTSKKKTLDDFLLEGKKPPMKIKPGLTRPKDYDVIIKGFNDPATIKKYKKK